MIMKFSYVSATNGKRYNFLGTAEEFLTDYYNDAKYFEDNESSVVRCTLDGENILTHAGTTIEEMMEEVERRVDKRKGF